MKGLFTGVRLENYFNENKTDAVNARRIINILDGAELISGYYKVIFNAIKDLKVLYKVNYPFAKDKWASVSQTCASRKKSDLSLHPCTGLSQPRIYFHRLVLCILKNSSSEWFRFSLC